MARPKKTQQDDAADETLKDEDSTDEAQQDDAADETEASGLVIEVSQHQMHKFSNIWGFPSETKSVTFKVM